MDMVKRGIRALIIGGIAVFICFQLKLEPAAAWPTGLILGALTVIRRITWIPIAFVAVLAVWAVLVNFGVPSAHDVIAGKVTLPAIGGPPAVEPSGEAAVTNANAIDRLRQLKQAKEEGLITEQEYNARREAILASF